jgi:hypothetical protein
MFSAFVPPVAFASLALWLLENVGSVYWGIVDWERRRGAAFGDALVGALEQSVPRAPYWLAVLLPLCVAGGYLYGSRRK